MPQESVRYCRSATLSLRECDEGFLAFDEASGKTSLLDSRAGNFLRSLDENASLPDRSATVPPAIDPAEMQQLLSSLELSGLIVRC